MGCSFCGLNAFFDVINGSGDVWINENRFRVVRQLGEGGFAFVYLVKEIVAADGASAGGLAHKKSIDPAHVSEDGTYAMKKVIIQTAEQLELVRQEIHVSSRFNHPNLLPLLDHAIITVKGAEDGSHNHEAYLLFPVHLDGTLFDIAKVMQSKKEFFSTITVLQIFRQLCAGLKHMHSFDPRYAHNDVKPGNVLITLKKGQPPIAILMDFGSARPARKEIRTRQEALQLQFSSMKDQGTRVVIYNLWEDDQGELELDFDADRYDIQIRGVNRDEKKIEMAKQFPNSRHFLTYRHSLRSYASILYLRLPHNFKMILRGKDIEHHNIVNDMMLKQEVTYKPQSSPDVPKDPNMVAVVTIGFVKDAKGHIDVQGFNVYHKNRLIKPFWRVWNAAGSDGRGVLGVLEANFVEPAHDKQDFERTTILSRLESKLIQMQKTYWSTNCHRIGYAPRCNKKHLGREDKEGSPDVPAHRHRTVYSPRSAPHKYVNDKPGKIDITSASSSKLWKQKGKSSSRDNEINIATKFGGNEGSEGYKTINSSPVIDHVATRLQSEEISANSDTRERIIEEFQPATASKDENEGLKKRIQELEEELLREKDRSKSLNDELQEMRIKLDASDKEQEALIDIFSEERSRRTAEEENLRRKLREALNTIQELRDGKVTTVGIASSC